MGMPCAPALFLMAVLAAAPAKAVPILWAEASVAVGQKVAFDDNADMSHAIGDLCWRRRRPSTRMHGTSSPSLSFRPTSVSATPSSWDTLSGTDVDLFNLRAGASLSCGLGSAISCLAMPSM